MLEFRSKSRLRRSTMTVARANLERLTLVTERFYERNLRMAFGLQHGFRALEVSFVRSQARAALESVR